MNVITPIDEIQVGDRIAWHGRRLDVIEVSPFGPNGRRITWVEDGAEPRAWVKFSGDTLPIVRAPIGYEAECSRCGETFCPVDEDDLEHLRRSDDVECGGQGILRGAWFANGERSRISGP